MNKRGISAVVAAVLLVLIVIILIIILWLLLSRTLDSTRLEIDSSDLRVRLRIDFARYDTLTGQTKVSLSRGAGEGNIVGYRFVFTNNEGDNYLFDEFSSMEELATTIFNFYLGDYIEDVTWVTATPIVKKEGKNYISRITVEKEVEWTSLIWGGHVIYYIRPTPLSGRSQTSTQIPLSLRTTHTDQHYVFANFEDDLILWYRFDNTYPGESDNNVHDWSGNGYDGTTNFVGGTVADVTGKFGGSFDFDGGPTTWINTPIDSTGFDVSAVENINELTVSAWAKFDSIGIGPDVVIEKDNSGGTSLTLSLYRVAAHAYFRVDNDDPTPNVGVAHYDNILSADTWHHLVGVYDGTTVSVYVDGVKGNVDDSLSGITYDSNLPVTLGYSGSWPGYDGSTDELLIFNRALSENEVKALFDARTNTYDNVFSGLAPGYYEFNGNTVNSAGVWNTTLLTRNVTIV